LLQLVILFYVPVAIKLVDKQHSNNLPRSCLLYQNRQILAPNNFILLDFCVKLTSKFDLKMCLKTSQTQGFLNTLRLSFPHSQYSKSLIKTVKITQKFLQMQKQTNTVLTLDVTFESKIIFLTFSFFIDNKSYNNQGIAYTSPVLIHFPFML